MTRTPCPAPRFLALLILLMTRWKPSYTGQVNTETSMTTIPDCPRYDGWACQWEAEYWKASSNASEYRSVTVVYEENQTRRVSIICDGKDPDSEPLPRGLLRNFTLGATTFFRFLLCPPPKTGAPTLGEILEGQRVRMLRFTTDDALEGALDPRILDDLPDVTYLSLTGNSLTFIPEDLFDRMPALHTVNLKDNQLTALPTDAFKSIVELLHLELGNNNLTGLDARVNGLSSLQTLNVYHNQISRLSADFFASTPSLRSVDLQGNLLEVLPTGVFDSLSMLKTLRLFSNRLTSLPTDILRQLRSLEHFDVSDNPQLTSMPPLLLQTLSSRNLSEVNLRRCGLRMLPKGFLRECGSLRTLHLEWNQLRYLEAGMFAGADGLVTLDLSRNRLESIPFGVFDDLPRLESLNLNRNQIRMIAPSAFHGLTGVSHLDLSRNSLTTISTDLFKAAINLQVLNLDHNQIEDDENGRTRLFTLPHSIRMLNLQHNRFGRLPSAWITESTLLVHLDLSYNRLQRFDSSDCQPTSDVATIDLGHNNITRVFVDLDWAAVLAQMNSPRTQVPQVLLGHNPLVCDCLAADLLQYVASDLHRFLYTIDIDELQCHEPAEFASEPFSLVRLDQLVCDEIDGCPPRCVCKRHAAGHVLEVDCRGLNLTAMPTMAPFNVSVLRLDHNRLKSLSGMNPMLWENLTELHLNSNDIDSLSDMNWLPSRLQLLDLQDNRLTSIEDGVLDTLDNLTSPQMEVFFGGNPWRCDCAAKHLKEWLNFNGKRAGNLSAILCHPSRTPLYKATVCARTMLSNKEVFIGATIVSLVSAVVLAMAGIGYYRYQRAIKVWLYAHNMCLWFVTESELDCDKTYDAFISFSQEDSEFVASHLLPGLEDDCHSYHQQHQQHSSRSHHEGGSGDGGSIEHRPAYKVCIHYRDWLAGEWIPDQIIRSVQDSRRTIVVLSKNFIKSVWGRLEFKAAHHQALQDRTNRIIMVVLGDLPHSSEMDAELKMYVKFNTYLKWDDPWFWQKLRYAMPHKPLRYGNNGRNGSSSSSSLSTTVSSKLPPSWSSSVTRMWTPVESSLSVPVSTVVTQPTTTFSLLQ